MKSEWDKKPNSPDTVTIAHLGPKLMIWWSLVFQKFTIDTAKEWVWFVLYALIGRRVMSTEQSTFLSFISP